MANQSIALTPNELASTRPGNLITGNNQITPIAPVPNPNATNPTTSTPNVSRTTLSNANKINAAPGIISKNQSLSNVGLSTDAKGNTVYSNGDIYTPPPSSLGYMDYSSDINGKFVPYGQANTSNTTPNTYTDYFGNTVPIMGNIPAGSVPDGKGNYLSPDGKQYTAPLNDTSYNVTYQQKQLADLKASVDSNTASIIDSIGKQYSQLMNEQQQVNSSQIGKVQNALLMGGVTGQGSTSQFASTSADSQVTEQMNYGVQQIQKLQNQEDQAIAAAKAAQEQQDYQIVDKQNALIESLRVEKLTAAQKLSDQISAATEQNQIDNAVTKLYTSGTTNPSAILKNLTTNGVTANGVPITLKDIQTSLTNQVPQGVTDLIATLTKNGAPSDVISKVMASPDLTTAITNSGDYLKEATGDMGTYLAYKRDAEANGHIPQDYATWQKAQDTRTANQEYGKAFATARGTAAGKASVDKSNIAMTPITDNRGIISNVPASVAPYMSVASNGVRYVDLSGFKGTPTEANQAVSDAQAAGLKVIVNKNSALDVQNITDAMSKLDRIKNAFLGIASDGAAQRDLYQAAFTTMASKLQTDPNATASNVYQDAALDVLKAMSGTQGFRGGASIVQQVKDTFPKNTDTKDVVNQKIANMQGLIQDRETALIGKPSASDQALIDGASAKNSVNTFYSTSSPQTQATIDKLITSGFDDTKVLDYLKKNNLYK